MRLSRVSVFIIFFFIISQILTEKAWQKEDRVIAWDIKSYYGYLPATFIHGDPGLHFLDDNSREVKHRDKYWHEVTPNGGKVFRMTMGLSMLYSPFFFLSHFYAKISGGEAFGYSPVYKIGLLCSAVFYLFWGFYFLLRVLRKHFQDWIVAVVLICIGLGTNLFYYSTTEAVMTHAYSFSLIATFIYLIHAWESKQTAKLALLLGLVFGLMVLIRPINLAFGFFFIFYKVGSFGELSTRISFLLRAWKWLFLAAVTAFLVCLPQLVYWKVYTGHFIFNSYQENGKFYFTEPEIFNVLFSYRKGLFVYTPLLFLAILGLIWMYIKNRGLFIPVLLVLVLNTYLIASWWCWWYGGSYGNRAFIDSYPFFALCLGYFLLWAYEKSRKWLLFPSLAVLFLCMKLNLFQSKQYYHTLIHWDGMTKEAYWTVFWTNEWPENYNELIDRPDYEAALNREEK